MKKNVIFFGALAAFAMASCSQDEVMEVNQDAINFAVTANTQSRALDSYCNNVLPASFKVWAQNTADNSLYIDGETVKNMGGNPAQWKLEGGDRYWTQSALNFFAEVNGDDVFNFNNGAPSFDNFKVADDVNAQVDLMYAVTRGATRDKGSVKINFRHALSQVCFRAQNTNAAIDVEIKGVSVGHIGSQASFTFPATETTETNWEHPEHGDNPYDVTLPGEGTWTNAQESALKVYSVAFSPVAVGATVTNLTCPGDNHDMASFAKTFTFIPQQVSAWTPQAGGTWNGAYFLVDCVIKDAKTGTVLHSGNTAIPVQVDWKQGKRYIYTFIFNNGNGGYQPNPDDPKPVLAPIDFDVTVDDFVPVEGGDITMDGDQVQEPEPQPEEYTYSLIYDPNAGNDAVTNMPKNQIVVSTDEKYTFTIDHNTVPQREGYIFKGWAQTADGDELEDATVTVYKNYPTATYFAVWEEEVVEYTYTLSFDNNPKEGTTTTPAPQLDPISVKSTESSVEITIPNQTITNGNWVFMGWAESANAKQAKYQPGDKVTLTAPEYNKTLYVVWGVDFTGGGAGGAGGTGW